MSNVLAADLPVVKPVVACSDLMNLDFRPLKDAPTALDSARVVTEGAAKPYCEVKGYVAPAVQFELRLPVNGWTQRFVMLGCGGFCGNATLVRTINSAPATSSDCLPVRSGELAVAAHNGGHVGSAVKGSDGIWAINNPTAYVDYAYMSNRKATVAAKAVIRAFYGQDARFSYFDGCSSGGRAALHMAQRYPDDYDGILAGAPTIDITATNVFQHAWRLRVNMKPDGTAILTADKIPALAKAVLSACADKTGMIRDPRTCKFEPKSLLCTKGDAPDCLTEEQVRAVNLIYRGPLDENGILLLPGGTPYGSELTWVGAMVLKPGEVFSSSNSGDWNWSDDWPNYTSDFGITGITFRNLRFTSDEFRRLVDKMAGIMDPTNPDLRAFAVHGGKLLMWQGWADMQDGAFATLNYYEAVRKYVGAKSAAEFMTLYLLPGVYHCAGGPKGANIDFLTPLMRWVEDKVKPGEVPVGYRSGPAANAPIELTKAAYPYAGPPANVSDVVDWAGLKHYRPAEQVWCEQKGTQFVCQNGGQ